MDMDPMCSMNMIWNTQIEDTCVVFKWWHVRSTAGFVASFFAIVALGVLYEWLRVAARDADRLIAKRLVAEGKGKARIRSGRATPESDSEAAGLLGGERAARKVGTPLPFLPRVTRAVLYGVQVFLSFFLMLVFMTYNAYLILAVIAGAAIGHFVFSSHFDINAALAGPVDSKGMSCH
ncbi:Ctr copper transporter [Fomitopsis serialis]|uniref:Ctr copper transporter n=1 Tax=Fomitopsis serialis TaxID=139415 RepID=UPI002008A19C|nr:Ctr copper transporter [Neoantrodia serialis]KAH9935771.1 Ctr copper transporter [Neoantrodia serialis]